MSVTIHFIDVGCGNMTLAIMPDGKVIMYDCNITDENEDRVLRYVQGVLGRDGKIDTFICSHREADHMRGIEKLHAAHPIQQLWDTGVSGTTTDSPEYSTYMDLRRRIPCATIEARKIWTYGNARLRCMNAAWPAYDDPNDESVVAKIEYKGSSVMLAGDTSYRPWKEKILTFYGESDLGSSILLAAHHGSATFFDDPSDAKNYYTAHIRQIKPAMTLISVGPNVYDLPDKRAVELYEKYSSGSNSGDKVYSTEDKGTMKLTLKDNGGWSLNVNQ